MPWMNTCGRAGRLHAGSLRDPQVPGRARWGVVRVSGGLDERRNRNELASNEPELPHRLHWHKQVVRVILEFGEAVL
jgi:hypothetical protein